MFVRERSAGGTPPRSTKKLRAVRMRKTHPVEIATPQLILKQSILVDKAAPRAPPQTHTIHTQIMS